MSFLASASGASSSRMVAQSVSCLSTRGSATSTMGISRKARYNAKKGISPLPKRREDVAEPWYFNYQSKLAVLKGGRLNTRQLSALVELYHATANHITKENLDAVIDAEFAPESGIPRTRPQMASLIDMHLEMNDPGFYSRPENDWRRIQAESVIKTGTTDGVENQFRNLAGTTLENAVPKNPADVAAGPDFTQRPNDWVGARDRELTPRQRMVVEALYGTDVDRRPGLEAIHERLKAESELDAQARAQFLEAQQRELSDAGDAVQGLNTDIQLEPHIYEEEDTLKVEEDPIAAEGVAEGGDVAPEEVLSKEAVAKP